MAMTLERPSVRGWEIPPDEVLETAGWVRKRDWVIPGAMLPERGMREVAGRDGERYLVRNDVMFTAVQHTQGEFSDFFLAIRDEQRLWGLRCPSCQHLIIPPFMRRCPSCRFIEMEKEEVLDTGVLAATPVITIFAPSRFKDQVPFGTGRVYLQTRDGGRTSTAMLVRVRTTLGAIRPGVYRRGTPVKLVFADDRRGEMLDLFAVPQSELSPAEVAGGRLFESHLVWNRAEEATFGEATPEARATLAAVVSLFQELATRIARSSRATENLAHWHRRVRVRTAGGTFGLTVADGVLLVSEVGMDDPDLTVTVQEPDTLLRWLRDAGRSAEGELASPPLTDLVLEGVLLLSKNELGTITRLDRVPRSLRRDGV